MRFFEYEARKIVELAGIPVTKYGFWKRPEAAPPSARRLPRVTLPATRDTAARTIRSNVLTAAGTAQGLRAVGQPLFQPVVVQ